MDRDVERMVADMEVRGLSALTRRIYRRRVERFAAHFGRPPGELGAEDVAAYFLHLTRERGLCAASRNQVAAALRFFFETTRQTPEMVAALPRARVTKPLPVVLSPAEVSRLLASFRSSKHRAIASLCYGAGLRVSEACELEIGDIDSERGLLRIRGKGAKVRELPLGERLLEELRAYWREHRPPRPLMFPSSTEPGRAISRRAFWRALQAAAARAGVAKHVSAHVLRHSYATHLVEAGVDLRSVQLLLGHAQLHTTMIYVHLTHARRAALPSPLDRLEPQKTRVTQKTG